MESRTHFYISEQRIRNRAAHVSNIFPIFPSREDIIINMQNTVRILTTLLNISLFRINVRRNFQYHLHALEKVRRDRIEVVEEKK